MKEGKLNKYTIVLGQVEHNGLHLLAAKFNMDYDQIITMALNDYLRKKLKTGEFNNLNDDDYTNHLIGETINANRNVWGYDSEVNDVPKDKKHLLLFS